MEWFFILLFFLAGVAMAVMFAVLIAAGVYLIMRMFRSERRK